MWNVKCYFYFELVIGEIYGIKEEFALCIFFDLEKAFDQVPREVWRASRKLDTNELVS